MHSRRWIEIVLGGKSLNIFIGKLPLLQKKFVTFSVAVALLKDLQKNDLYSMLAERLTKKVQKVFVISSRMPC